MDCTFLKVYFINECRNGIQIQHEQMQQQVDIEWNRFKRPNNDQEHQSISGQSHISKHICLEHHQQRWLNTDLMNII